MKILFPAVSSNVPEKTVEASVPIPAVPDIQPLRDALLVLKKDLNEWREETGASIGALKQAIQVLEERLTACEKLPVTPAPAPALAQISQEVPKKTFNPDLERLRQSLGGTVSPAKGSIFSRFWTYLNESDAEVPVRRP